MDSGSERRIGHLARRQHGVVTRAQLRAPGLGAGALRHRTTCGSFSRLHRGVYLVGPIMPPRAQEMAAVLACGTTALLADHSAARLWGLVSHPQDASGPVQVMTVGKVAVDRPGICVRRVLRIDSADRARFDGIPVTSPVRTLLDLSAVAGALELEQAVARAEQEGLVRPGQLAAGLARRRGRPGAPAMRAVLELAGGPALTRSEAETRFLELVRQAQLPPPQTNARVAGLELDFLWRDHGLAVEVDGFRFHSSRSRFESDRRRVARLSTLGIQVIPITWRQIVEEGTATAVRLGQALLQAELHRGR